LASALECHQNNLLMNQEDSIVHTLLENNLLEKLSPHGDFEMVEKIFLNAYSDSLADKTKAELFIVLSNTSWRCKRYEKGLDYANQALKIGLKLNNNHLIFEAYFHIGTIYSITGDHQVLAYLNKAYRIREYARTASKIAGLCNNLAMTYREMGQLEKSLIFMEESYKHFEIEDKYYNLCICCQGFMTIYNELQLPNKALTYGNLGKAFARKASFDNGYKSILLYELDSLSQLNQSISLEHVNILECVLSKTFIDYYALEAVLKYLILNQTKDIDHLFELYIDEVPLFVKGILYALNGDIKHANEAFEILKFDSRIKSI
jgi:hypothetical protein